MMHFDSTSRHCRQGALFSTLYCVAGITVCFYASAGVASTSAQVCEMNAEIVHYLGNDADDIAAVSLRRKSTALSFHGGRWLVEVRDQSVGGRDDTRDITTSVTFVSGAASSTGIAIRCIFAGWSRANYVLMPGAVYDGNRFHIWQQRYPPMWANKDYAVNPPITTTAIPHLESEGDSSRIEDISGNLASPSIGIRSAAAGQGYWFLTQPRTEFGDMGVTVEETRNGSRASILFSAPVMRNNRSTINGPVKSNDHAPNWMPGQKAVLKIRMYRFPCRSIQTLFDHYRQVRDDAATSTVRRQQFPLSAATQLLEEKFNAQNWNDKGGFYLNDLTREDGKIVAGPPQFELGWTGGGQNTLAMLVNGSKTSQERALRNLQTIFSKSQADSGFFYTVSDNGEHWYADAFDYTTNPDHLVLIRGEADFLYSAVAQLTLLKKHPEFGKSSPEWAAQTGRLADAFVRLWRRYGQFGQFINMQRGRILVGGTTSAGIAPAGLALASRFYHSAEYLQVAEEAGEYFYRNFTQKGLSVGGPGDALQAPDSESAYALLTSYVVLYDVTGEQRWLKAAKEMANQFATWVMAYDYQFPASSTFGKLGMQTRGTVFANAQNKTGTASICTWSGDALLRLYLDTGDLKYLHLLQEIIHTGPQYISRSDRPIDGMQGNKRVATDPGWVYERVQTGDWEDPFTPIGETAYASIGWVGSAIMLSYAEVPGLYVEPSEGRVVALDHIDVTIARQEKGAVTVRLTNPTRFAASVRTMVQSGSRTHLEIGQVALLPKIDLTAGETACYRFSSVGGSADVQKLADAGECGRK